MRATMCRLVKVTFLILGSENILLLIIIITILLLIITIIIICLIYIAPFRVPKDT